MESEKAQKVPKNKSSKPIKKEKNQEQVKEKKEKKPQLQKPADPMKKKLKFQQMKDKKKQISLLFKDRVPDRTDSDSLASYMNSEIVRHIAYSRVKKNMDEKVMRAMDKFEKKQENLFDLDNVDQTLIKSTIATTIYKLVDNLRVQDVKVKSLGIPQIMIITPDTQKVVDVYQELKTTYANDKKGTIPVRVSKLFAKHISIEDHEKYLKSEQKGEFINVYVGTPNRIKKLVERGAISVKKSTFKHLLIDSHLSAKSQSLFDITETRDDTFDLLILSQKHLLKKNLLVTVI
eukprot:403363206